MNIIDHGLHVLAGNTELEQIAKRLTEPVEEGDAYVADKERIRTDHFHRTVKWADDGLRDVSESFPTAVFLLERYDEQGSWSRKTVIRNGEIIQDVFDDNQQSQALNWTLPDIFAPFEAEYRCEVPFGSLWQKWLTDMTAQLQSLKNGNPRRDEEGKRIWAEVVDS